MGPYSAILTIVLLAFPSSHGDKVLNLMGFLPMTGDVLPCGGACLPALEMAVSHINARDDILPGYRLNLVWEDTKVSGIVKAGTCANE